MLFPLSAVCFPCHILTWLLPSHFLDLSFTSLTFVECLLSSKHRRVLCMGFLTQSSPRTLSQVALLFSQRVSMNKSVTCGVRAQTQALRTASLLLHLPLPY